jgi:hypothetical protein
MVLAQAFAALLLTGLAFGVIVLAGALAVDRWCAGADRWIGGVLAIALAGYGIFWLGFVQPRAGAAGAWVVVSAAGAILFRRWRDVVDLIRRAAPVAAGMTLFVFAATAVLLLYPGESIAATAQHRFFAMPGDNDIPRVFAQIIRDGNPTRVLGGDWLTSDRPPLQSGVALLSWPLLGSCRIEFAMTCATAGIWFQALWFPAVWALLRALGLRARAALGVTAALSATGFLVCNTVYTWPKLGAAAFVVLAFLRWFGPGTDATRTRSLALGGACAACGWLAHGGVMFSLLALAPFALVDAMRRRAWRGWLGAAGVFLVLAAPWLLYQKFYAPPGNRLVKWHIAGVIAPDARSVTQALRDHYHEIGWRGAWEARVQNFRMLGNGNWLAPFDPRADAVARRTDDVAWPLRTTAGWTLGLAALPWLVFARGREVRGFARQHALTAGWLAGGLVMWLALIFAPNTFFTHLGSYVTQLLLLALLAAWARLAGRIFFLLVAAVQWIGFAATWLAPAAHWSAPLDRLATSVAVASGTALLGLAVWATLAEEKLPNA